MVLALAVLLAAQTFANATVVSTDVALRTLTFTRDGGTREVLAVDADAVARLQALKPGDEVILTLRGDAGAPLVVAAIEPSVRGTRPKTRYRPGEARRAPASPPHSAAPAGRNARQATPRPKAGPTPKPTTRPPTDTVGPLQDPRKGAQQDPRDNPDRDPRVVPGLTEPPSPVPSPTPTPGP